MLWELVLFCWLLIIRMEQEDDATIWSQQMRGVLQKVSVNILLFVLFFHTCMELSLIISRIILFEWSLGQQGYFFCVGFGFTLDLLFLIFFGCFCLFFLFFSVQFFLFSSCSCVANTDTLSTSPHAIWRITDNGVECWSVASDHRSIYVLYPKIWLRKPIVLEVSENVKLFNFI